MPRGDRTGPRGEGPKSGRQAGFCADYDEPGYFNAGGFGGRSGRGSGRGASYYPRRGFGSGRGSGLRDQGEYQSGKNIILSDQLNSIEKRLSDIEGRISQKDSD